MDFLQDSLAEEIRLGVLTLVDAYIRNCLANAVATSLPGARVVQVLDQVCSLRGTPEFIVVDNGLAVVGLS